MWIKRGVILLVLLALTGACVYTAYQVDDGMQYIALAPQESAPDPEKPEPSALSGLIKKLEDNEEDWREILSCWALTGSREEVSLAGRNAQTVTARLVGVYGNVNALPPMIARFGRGFYEEDLENGENIILLTEQLAIALFRTGDPIDRIVEVDGTEYRVAGILRQKRTLGDHDEYTAYVPLLSLDKTRFQWQTLTVSARPVPGSGAASQFKNDMNAWSAGGDLHLLSKERYRALLPVRALVFLAGCWVAAFVWRRYKGLAVHFYRDIRARLEHRFAVQLFPRMTGYAALLLVFGALWLLGLYALVQLVLDAVYTFPEWVPTIPVEVPDILKTVWQNQTAITRAVSLRSPELMLLRFCHGALCGLCAVTGLLLSKWYGELRGAAKQRDTMK